MQSEESAWDRIPGKFQALFAGTSFEFRIDVERQLVQVKFRKKMTAEEIGRYAKHLSMHPSFRQEFSEIVDLRETEEVDLQADDFLKLADEVDPFLPEAKRAFVVTSAVQSHAARMHRILRSRRNIEIFSSLEEAERWIRS